MTAYQFNLAVLTAGLDFENEHSKSSDKPQEVVTGSPLPLLHAAGIPVKKMALPADGIW